MDQSVFLTRVVLRNYKSIAACDVRLSPLTYLVGPNGSGKSNFIDALHFVSDALNGALDSAINRRGGFAAVCRQSRDNPGHFGIRLEFNLASGDAGFYAFAVKAQSDGGYVVEREECSIGAAGNRRYFLREHGRPPECSEPQIPDAAPDVLALVGLSWSPSFGPVVSALKAMGFYDVDPKAFRQLQQPQNGTYLMSSGENIASVLGCLAHANPKAFRLFQDDVHAVVPSVRCVDYEVFGTMATLSFTQDLPGSAHAQRFPARNMSDGTLRAVGVLAALVQGETSYPRSLVAIEAPETGLHAAALGSLREALMRAAERTQVIVTTLSADLLDDRRIPVDALLVVESEAGTTRIGSADAASRKAMRDYRWSAGQLLRIDGLAIGKSTGNHPHPSLSDLFGHSLH